MNAREFEDQSNACRRRLLHAARRMTRCAEEAEDVVQRTFVRAWRYRDRFNPLRCTFYGWCLLQMKHILWDDHRYPSPVLVSYDDARFVAARDEIYTLIVQEFLDHLEQQERSIIEDLMNGCSVAETARRHSVPPALVRAVRDSLRPLASVCLQ